MIRDLDIAVTKKAQSKTRRLLPEFELRAVALGAVLGDERCIYQRLDSDDPEYHVRTGPYSVVLKVDPDGTVVVVTQMHAHPDYHKDDRYVEVEEVPMS